MRNVAVVAVVVGARAHAHSPAPTLTYAEAAEVYRADLAVHEENGWSLFGLARALELLKDPSAASIRARFEAAWKRADVKLTSSVL